MGSFKNDLSVVTGYSEIPIFQLIGKPKSAPVLKCEPSVSFILKL